MHLEIRAGHKTDVASIKCDGYGCNPLSDERYLRAILMEILFNRQIHTYKIQIQKYKYTNKEIHYKRLCCSEEKVNFPGLNKRNNFDQKNFLRDKDEIIWTTSPSITQWPSLKVTSL